MAPRFASVLCTLAFSMMLATPPAKAQGGAPVVLLSQFGTYGTGPGQLFMPDAISWDRATGTHYILNLAGEINLYDVNGAWLGMWDLSAQLNGQGLAVDGSGNVHVVDGLNHRILVLDRSGQIIRTYGTRGTAAGQINYPCDASFNPVNGLLYVCDQHRVQAFTVDGTYQFTVMSSAGGYYTYAVSTDATTGNAYVIVRGTGSAFVRVYSPANAFLFQFGNYGTEPGQFTYPRKMSVDAKQRIWVTDSENQRVVVFTTTGSYLYQLTDPALYTPFGILCDEQGKVWITGHYGNPHADPQLLGCIFGDRATPARSTSWGRLKSLYLGGD